MASSDAADRDSDPTLIRNQAALRNSEGTIWLVVGAVFVGVALVVFLPFTGDQPALAWASIAIVAALYVAMIVVRLAVRPRRARLVTLAVLLILVALTGLVCIMLISMGAWTPVLT